MDKRRFYIPDNDFDGVIVPVYKQNPKFFGLSRREILTEIKRVCKPDSLIVLVSVMDMPVTNDNFFMNELIKIYNMALNNRIFTKEQLKKDMQAVNLKDINLLNHQGLLIGIGKNS
jgi:ubiquinone/menaquinone biosynthesis C-methylase UbiE